MSPCEFCNDEGAAYRPRSGARWVAAVCDCCGRSGSPAKLARLNAQDDARTTGVRQERCQFNVLERAFRDEWRNSNCPMVPVNGGIPLLQLLMSPTMANGLMNFSDLGKRVAPEEICTERDYKVAATVIQWLGTNIGQCFLQEAADRAKRLMKGEA